MALYLNSTTNYTVALDGAVLTPTDIICLIMMCLDDSLVFILNVMVLFIVLSSPQMRNNSTNIILCNLFVLDTLASLLVIPFTILHYASSEWLLSAELCSINGFLNALLIFASVFSLVLISIERFYSIAFPMSHAANASLTKAVLAAGTVWTISILCAIPPCFGVNSFEYRPHRGHCSFSWDATPSGESYIIFVLIVCFTVPACVLISMYAAIFYVARKTGLVVKPIAPPPISVTNASNAVGGQLQTSPPIIESAGAEHMSADEHDCGAVVATVNNLCRCGNGDVHATQNNAKSNSCKAAKTLTVVTVFFIAFWGPIFIVEFIGLLYGNSANEKLLAGETMSTWLVYTGFAMNAVFYGLLNRQIREETVNTFKTCAKKCTGSGDEVEDFMPQGDENFFQFLERTSVVANSQQASVGCQNSVKANVSKVSIEVINELLE